MSDRERRTGDPVRRPRSGADIDPARLVRIRVSRGLNRQELCDLIPQTGLISPLTGKPLTLSRDAIAKIENGQRKPKPRTLQALCRALNCEPEDLLRDAPDPVVHAEAS